MGAPILVPLNECPTGIVVHDPHEWYGGLFWSIKYGCSGLSMRYYKMIRVLEAGSAGTLTQEQIDDYLETER